MTAKKKTTKSKKTASKKSKVSSFDSTLLDILACPVAVHMTDKGNDPGALRLYKESWLISDVSGYKYPIIKGVPILLKEVGEKWLKKEDKDLPVPPPEKY